MGFLDGLKVLDATDERGLLAGRLLADLGADVVQVEPPSGSPARCVPPFGGEAFGGEAFGGEAFGGLAPSGEPLDGKASLFWEVYAANKRGVVCDTSTSDGRDELLRLLSQADFFIESADPGHFDALGLGWDDVHRINPRLIYVSITPFGRDGPKAHWAATDLTVWAAGGPLAYNRDETGPPLRISVPQTYLHAAADAAGGALLAHHARRRTGLGQHVDVSAQASLGLCTLAAALTAVTGDTEPDWIPKPGGPVAIDQSGSGSRTRRSKWPVRDGYVELHLAMGPAVGAFTNNFFAWMREEGALPDDDISSWDWRSLPEEIRAGRVGRQQIERARDLVGDFLATKTKQEVTDAALVRKLLSVEVADVSDLAHSGHFEDRGFLINFDRPGRSYRMPGPIAATASAAFSFRRPAPRLGEHQSAVRAEWGAAADEQAHGGADRAASTTDRAASTAAQSGFRPLEGLRVADLSWVVAGPVIGRALADFGATVVRVESAAKIETARHMAPYYGGHPGVENSALYINCNAGKLGLALNLGSEEGRETVRDLAGWADVLIESYTPGLMTRWDLGYEVLAADNPGLIMMSSSLMGNTGRYSRLAGYGNIGAAMSGFQHIVGWPGRPPIGPFGPYTDYVAPRLALVSLLAALEKRERTGHGCYLDVSQVECGVWFLAAQLAEFAANGTVQGAVGNRDARYVPHGVFACQCDDPGRADHVAIVARHDEDFAALAGVMGLPDLATDPRYATPASRRAHEDELEAVIAAWAAARRAEEIEEACQAAGVPAHRASTSTDFVTDAQLAHRGHLIRLEHARHGAVVVEAPRYLLSATPGRVDRPAPAIGEHTEEVLGRLVGLTDDRIEALDKMGVLR
jgi:crotonobetainyl-CoA:carnitine CoA-transferase CaiB-like acyl-CoA transferase